MRTARTKLICAALLTAITLAVYWPVTGFEFINYDDPDYVTYNPMVQQGITAQSVAWAFTKNDASNWHPLTWISHMVDCQVYGLKPGGHHLTNLLFHVANTALLFLVLSGMTGALWRSALVAALFAWHPLHVESVAWVSERKDVLSTFFWLLTMAAYARYAALSKVQSPSASAKASTFAPATADKPADKKSKMFYALALFCFALGLLSKPMVVTLPFVLLLLDFWPLGRIYDLRFTIYKSEGGPRALSLGKALLEKIPFFVLAGAACAATIWAQKAANSIVSADALSWPDRFANALVSYMLYLAKTVWPMDLAVPYPYSHVWSFWQAAGAGAVLLSVTAAVLLRWRQQPHLAVGWFWFLGTLVPVIGLMQVGIQFMADRYTYIPLIGIFMMVVWSVPANWAKWPRPGLLFWTAASAVMILLLLATSLQLSYWRDSVALFGHTTAVTQDNILAEYNLAEALARKGDEPDAVTHYLKALAIRPNRVEALYNSQPQAHFNLGVIYQRNGMLPEAEAQFRASEQADPGQAPPHNALASVLLATGRFAEAAGEYQTLAQLEPANPGARRNLGLALSGEGKIMEAEKQFREALRLDPNAVEALDRLAWELATSATPESRDGAEAVRLAEHARDLTKAEDPRVLATLDASYAEAGRFAEAIATAQKTAQIANAQGQMNVAAAANARLKLYEDGKPFRE